MNMQITDEMVRVALAAWDNTAPPGDDSWSPEMAMRAALEAALNPTTNI